VSLPFLEPFEEVWYEDSHFLLLCELSQGEREWSKLYLFRSTLNSAANEIFGKISPTLFNLCLHPILTKLHEENILHQAYADDTIILL